MLTVQHMRPLRRLGRVIEDRPMLPGPPRRRRARPVADAPIDALLSRSRTWPRVAAGPARAGAARRGAGDPGRRPERATARGCARRCCGRSPTTPTSGGSSPAARWRRSSRARRELAGAGGAEATSRAVDALQAVIWAALRASFRARTPDLISGAGRAPGAGDRDGARRGAARRRRCRRRDRRVTRPRAAPQAAIPATGRAAPAPEPPAARRGRVATTGALRTGRRRAWLAGEQAGPEPEAAVDRGARGGDPTRCGGSPLSLLLAELEDADRVLAVESRAGAAATFGEFAQAVRGAVRRQDILVVRDRRAGLDHRAATPGAPGPRRSARGSPTRSATASRGVARRWSPASGWRCWARTAHPGRS